VLGGTFSAELIPSAIIYALILLVMTLSMGGYAVRLKEGAQGMFLRSLVSYCLLGAAVLIVLSYILPFWVIGRKELVVTILLSLVVVTVVRAAFFLVVDDQRLRKRVIIYGAGASARQLLGSLHKYNQSAKTSIVACVKAGSADSLVENVAVIEDQGALVDYAREHNINEIVVALDERRRDHGGVFPLDELLDCKLAGINVLDAMEFSERELGIVELKHLHPGWMLFSQGFKFSRSRDFVKRLFDLMIGFILLAMVWPFMLLTAIAVRLESRGPVLYSQERSGLNGKAFKIYKFRSMTVDAEKDGKAVWAAKNDNRITRVGGFIRNTRLDELPQIYNLLRGEMSFVGPRPERPQIIEELKEQIPFYHERHRVKPGLMGWAQLNYPYGATMEDAENKLRYDLYYTKNHSILLDILIVIQTVEVILLGKGVH
jgi:sugar transferase (PEP-CTERM system associated)